MYGLILNEDGYVTYPYNVFRVIEDEVRSLKWRITNVECGSSLSYEFPFEHEEQSVLDGNQLMDLLKDHSDIQWWWGILSGFSKGVPDEAITRTPIHDIQAGLPCFSENPEHIESQASIELIAFDSSETYVLLDDESLAIKLKAAFLKAENLEKFFH